ncbi:MAG: hypothetical protein ABJZ55_07075 [Fuerstiella sp.]
MNTATVPQQILNTDLLIRFVEVWHIDEASQQPVPMNAIALNDDSSQPTPSQHVHSDDIQAILRSACETKTVAMIDSTDDALVSLSQHVGCEISLMLCFPIVQERQVRGAIVIGLSDVHGAIEVWGRDDRDELAIINGHYSGLPSFEYITRYTRFPKGAGLPGGVWKSGVAKVANKLEKSSAFIRSFGCDPASVSAAVALPFADMLGFPKSVVMFLQAAQQPLSRHTMLLSGTTTQDSNQTDSADSNSDEIPAVFQIESVQAVYDSRNPATADDQFQDQFQDQDQQQSITKDIQSVIATNAPLLLKFDGPVGSHRLVWPVYGEHGVTSVLIMTF